MTAKEYLEQAYWLDLKINDDLRQVENLRKLVVSISSPGLGEKVVSSGTTEPSFVRVMEKILLLEDKINNEVDTLVDLKEQISLVIGMLENPNEQLVLQGRYVLQKSWRTLATDLHADPKTIRKWHATGIKNIILPANPISIRKKVVNP